MATPKPVAHAGQYVLKNEDAAFKAAHSEKAAKKKGSGFWSVEGPDGKTSAVGYKAGMAVCVDGAPNATTIDPGFKNGKPIANPETWAWWDDKAKTPLDQTKYPIITIPQGSAGDALKSRGVRAGDYVRVTNSANGQSAFGIVGELGPTNEVGEISQDLGKRLNMRDQATLDAIGMKPLSEKQIAKYNANKLIDVGGKKYVDPLNPTIGGTNKQLLDFEYFPGSGKAKGRAIEPQTPEEIQKNGAKVAATREAYKTGYLIKNGASSILIGPSQSFAAFADTSCLHEGGGSLFTGSDSVFFENKPASRIGDDCTLSLQVVSGDGSVLVGGGKRTAPIGPPPPWNLQFQNHELLPKWAERVVEPVAGPSHAPTFESLTSGAKKAAAEAVTKKK